MNDIRILLADDDNVFRRLTTELLQKEGYNVVPVACVDSCTRALKDNHFDIMMLDMCFPALQDGFSMLSDVHENYPELPVLMISGSGNIPDAVLAIKNGATDFIEKPIDSTHLRMRLRRLSESIVLNTQILDMQIRAIGMKGNSEAMQTVYSGIIRAAQFDCPLLISGETGVGKELAARAVHRLSKYTAKNLITINCASVPKDLFEAELFGYEVGAFTGATKARKGYFEYADNNSFFMDEISQLPLEVQAKLLRVVSEGEIQKLGGKISKVNTRLISASNQDLAQMCELGTFRSDLLYRLNTIRIEVPPLRNRIEDIPLLADFFMTEFCTNNDLQPKTLTSASKAWLCEQSWPGNVRELKNTIERAVIFAKNDHLAVVDFTTVKQSRYAEGETSSLRAALASFEKAYIENILIACEYNIRETAKQLQMDKSNLFKKISALGIKHPSK